MEVLRSSSAPPTKHGHRHTIWQPKAVRSPLKRSEQLPDSYEVVETISMANDQVCLANRADASKQTHLSSQRVEVSTSRKHQRDASSDRP